MKSVVAFAFGAIAGIFGFQKHQELRGNGATKTSSSKNAIVEAKRTTGEDAAPAKKDKGKAGKKRTKVIGVIPARYASTRFPGKPLANIMKFQ